MNKQLTVWQQKAADLLDAYREDDYLQLDLVDYLAHALEVEYTRGSND